MTEQEALAAELKQVDHDARRFFSYANRWTYARQGHWLQMARAASDARWHLDRSTPIAAGILPGLVERGNRETYQPARDYLSAIVDRVSLIARDAAR